MMTKELRKAQGVLAAQIKTQHKTHKELQRGIKHNPEDSFSQRIARLEPLYKTMHGWQDARKEFRHRHIGYSLARGRTMEQIEKPSEENKKVNAELIAQYKAEYEAAFAEGRAAYEARRASAVCAGA